MSHHLCADCEVELAAFVVLCASMLEQSARAFDVLAAVARLIVRGVYLLDKVMSRNFLTLTTT